MKKQTLAPISSFLLFTLLTVGGLNSANAYATNPAKDPVLEEIACPTVDLRQDFNFGLVRNQKNIGWCYSYAAADLIGFKMKTRLSSFDIAFSVAQLRLESGKAAPAKKITDVHGGSGADIFRALARNGVCPAAKFSPNDPHSIDALYEVERDLSNLVRGVAAGTIDDTQLYMAILGSVRQYRILFPTTSVADLMKAIKDTPNLEFPIIGVANSICGKKLFPKLQVEVETLNNGVSEEMRFHAVKGILASRRPVFMAYSADVLRDASATTVGGHASTLIGMKFNKHKNRCEFLLRNSWGSSLNMKKYATEITSARDGYLWIPEHILLKNIQYTIWIM